MDVMSMFGLSGKVAVVTGGAGLYGASISEALCEAGATVLIASRSRERCEEEAAKLRGRGYRAEGMRLDMADEISIGSFTAETADRHGRIDILINNSVSRTGLADIEQTTSEGWTEAQRVNGLGLMLLTKAVVARMRDQGGGTIINIASIQGVLGPHFPVYGETGMTSGIEYTYAKWGMVGMTKWLANYYGKYGIRVNCISPGGYNPVGTDREIRAEEFVRSYIERTPLGRMANDTDIKGAIVYLASDASRYVTGHNLIVDGGWSSW
ncbi:MAG: short-chain dehydrogenase/reductase [Paenibacillus sp.]|jgi:NAD(P)-dependent dehydrogenase (short-subunit alcohol dehydrogenase family)|uniref:SDR family NAD(P)-dependent oxidoreductase n=1 Tax=Paenibacillus sp. GCM10012303 TaxID=3317340 RepID=UPI0029F0407E|nr:short-chain dehydrogenase/reductase [Paenibacillus sp.]